VVRALDVDSEVLVAGHEPPALTLELSGLRRRFRVIARGEEAWVHGPHGSTHLVEVPRFAHGAHEDRTAGCVAPMPGKVLEVHVREGDRVVQGQVVVTLEAMKMEHAVAAPIAALVTRVLVGPADQVDAGALLVDLEPDEAE
jgi:propionyl-CoA carboxylase alpha chain